VCDFKGESMIAKRIKEVRNTLNLTQEQLARELDVTVSTINRWENGKCKPHRALVKQLETMIEDKSH
jgi:DNA-binding transcriptional regulator YiaG